MSRYKAHGVLPPRQLHENMSWDKSGRKLTLKFSFWVLYIGSPSEI
jgi:hypothetical protein